jgi:hypothetical protein
VRSSTAAIRQTGFSETEKQRSVRSRLPGAFDVYQSIDEDVRAPQTLDGPKKRV